MNDNRLERAVRVWYLDGTTQVFPRCSLAAIPRKLTAGQVAAYAAHGKTSPKLAQHGILAITWPSKRPVIVKKKEKAVYARVSDHFAWSD